MFKRNLSNRYITVVLPHTVDAAALVRDAGGEAGARLSVHLFISVLFCYVRSTRV